MRKIIRNIVIGAILLVAIYTLYISSQTIIKNNKLQQESENSLITSGDVLTGDIANILTGSSSELTGENMGKKFQFVGDCDIKDQGEYKILTVFSGNTYSPLDPKEYLEYTKPYTIDGNIEDAKLCIVSDIVDYRKRHQYTYSTYILFSSAEYAGHLNVGYSKNNSVMYDYRTSPNEPFLNGLFWGDEAPKIYNLDLNNVRVANTQDKGWKRIHPIKRLQQQGAIRIGGFVNAKDGEGIIKKFIVAYKCSEGSECSIK